MPDRDTNPPPALLAEVTRGDAVESRHFGHVAVVDASGRLLFGLGDPDRAIYPRSAVKPLQALAGVALGTVERFGFSDAELAVICASHAAEARHLEAVGSILAKVGATEDDLHCGPHPIAWEPTRDALIREGRQPGRIHSNCSGKHSGMLALARLLGAPLHGYWEAEHPVQREVQRTLSAFCGVDPAALRWGVDGCGVPTYLLPLSGLALGFGRLADADGVSERDEAAARKITTAMNAEPEMVRGTGGFDSVLMRALPGVTASKGGAEGCHVIGLLGKGIGLAIKVDDGSPRALTALTLSLLRRFVALPDPLPETLRPLLLPEVTNTRGDVVGEIRPLI